MRLFNKCKGSVTIFLILIMLPMFTFAGLIVDGAKIEAGKSMLSGAGDLAMNAALSEYDEVLKDVYGLFAMSETPEELQENLQVYFENTLTGNNLLQGSDSYTRNFMNSISSYFSSPSEQSFDNLVDLQASYFEATHVPNSQLSNPEVLKRQIVEYMKYRGPASLTAGFLTKLNIFGDVPKQNDAMEAKIEYDTKLDEVQDACEAAFEAIVAYLNYVKDNYTSEQMEARFVAAKDKYKLITDNLIYGYSSPHTTLDWPASSSSGSMSAMSGHSGSLQSALSALSAANLNQDNAISKTEYIYKAKDYISGIFRNYEADFQAYQTWYNALPPPVITRVEISFGDSPEVIAGKLESNRQSEEAAQRILQARQEDYNAMSDVKSKIDSIKSTAQSKKDTFGPVINQMAKEVQMDFNTYRDIADTATDLAEKASKKLEDVLEAVEKLKDSRIDYSKKVEVLSEGDIKTSMKNEYASKAKDINEDAIKALQDVLGMNVSYFEEVKRRIESVSFLDSRVYENNSDYARLYHNKIPQSSYTSRANVPALANNTFTKYMTANLVGIELTKQESDKYQFYRYLERICSKSKTESPSKKEQKAKKKQIMDEGKKPDSNEDTAVLTSGKITDFITDEEVWESIAGIQDEDGKEPYEPVDADKEAKDKDIAKSNKANMSSMKTFINDFGTLASDVLEKGRDDLYLTEYIMKMFSYYTIDKDKEGGTITDGIVTLSNVPINQNNNVFYKSEAEYILWGSPEVKNNVANTQALIFGLRFILNASYAFTDAEIRNMAFTMAVAIAGWTGFGVPIVQTVITLALALAESALDVRELSKGKAVAFFKGPQTWVLKPSRVAKQVIEEVKEELVEEATRQTNKLFDKVEQVTEGTIDGMKNELMGEINKFTENTKESAIATATGAIVTPLQNIILKIITDSTIDEQINTRINSEIEELRATIEEEPEGLSRTAKIMLLDNVINNQLPALRGLISRGRDTFNNGVQEELDALSITIEEDINYIIEDIKAPIVAFIDEYSQKFKDDTQRIINGTKENVQEELTNAINDYSAKFSSTVDSNGKPKAGVGAGTGGFTLTYEEYLKIFILLGTFSDPWENAMLNRTTLLIQANIANGNTVLTPGTRAFEKNPSFNIGQAYTLIRINAKASVKTTFMNIPLVTTGVNSDGTEQYEFDYKQIGKSSQTISYVGIDGY